MADSSGRFLSATAMPAAPLEQLPSWVALVRAPNPGPMTLDGTNTWVLRHPDADAAVVIDPGPGHDQHLAAVATVAAARRVTVITTHGHHDHTEGVDRFLQLCPQAVVADPRPGSDRPEIASALNLAGLELTILPTPGHTADSITLVASAGAESVVLTGDTILGRGTTVVAHPDGDLGDYLDSLRRLATLGQLPVLPGHGPALADCAGAASYYLDHRLGRLEQVRAALAAGAHEVGDVVRTVYPDLNPELRPAAEWSVRAQLAYLARESTEAPARLDPP